MTVTILLVDDHPMIRHGLRRLLENEPEFAVIGEATDGLDAIQTLEKTKPDILIIDLMMPNLNGIAVLIQIKKISPKTRAIVFSMQSAEPYILEAIQTGAEGYVLKDTGPGEIVEAINTVLAGDRYLSGQLSERINLLEIKYGENLQDPFYTLTIREREILQMTASGHSSTEIGKKLNISSRTVEVHRRNIMRKLGLKNQAELIRYSIKRGLIATDT